MIDKFFIAGKHAVLCALNNPSRPVYEVYTTRENNNLNFKKTKIVDKSFFKKIFKGLEINHQNTAALVSPLKSLNLKEEISKKKINKLVILNGISDQRNIGSIIRTVLALNFDGIVLEKKFFSQKNPIMIKASSGAIEFLNFFVVSNIKNEIKTLKKENFQIIGLDSNSTKNLKSLKLQNKFALIFGSEGEGIKNTVLNNCDEILKLQINKHIKSLNVSNAVSAVLATINTKLYE